MRKSTVKFRLFLSLAVAGCSTSTANSDPPLTVDTFNAAYRDAWCAALGNCARGFFWFGSVDDCKAFYFNSPTFPADVAKVHAGRIAFNVERATNCLASFRTTKCVLLQPESSACHDMLSGTVANGKGCESDDVCASGWCKGATKLWAGSHPTCGVCAEALKVGAACDGGCAFGSACVGQVCTAIGSVGVGGTCKYGSDCVASAFCHYSVADGSFSCKKRSAIGEKCGRYYCNPDAVCLPADVSEAAKGDGTCGPPRKLGDACFWMNSLANDNGDCGDGNVCGVIGKWDGKEAPTLRCVSHKLIGQDCTSHWECGMLDAVCVDGKCALWPSKGQKCAEMYGNPDCGPNGACGSDGKCAGWPKAGETCNGSGSCGIGQTCSGAAGKAICVKLAAVGEACAVDSDCLSQLTCNGEHKCGEIVCK